jgi:hypothetical protein
MLPGTAHQRYDTRILTACLPVVPDGPGIGLVNETKIAAGNRRKKGVRIIRVSQGQEQFRQV